MANLSDIPVTLRFDLTQFLLFFEQLPLEYKRLVITALEEKANADLSEEKSWESLKGSLLKYELPFEPVSLEDWNALK